MLRRVLVGFCWLSIALVVLLQLFLLMGDTRAGLKLVPVAAVLVAVSAGLISVLRRREELAHNVEEHGMASRDSVPAAGARESFIPLAAIACHHAVRGSGRLGTHEDGSLHFVASPGSAPIELAYLGIDIEKTAPWRLSARKFMVILAPSFREQLRRADRNLFIPRHHLRFSMPMDRAVAGPSVVISHAASADRVRLEEFFLSAKDAMGFRHPTADAHALARDIGLPDPSHEERQEALMWRRRVHRRIALADWIFAVVILAVLFAAISVLLWMAASSSGSVEPSALLLTIGVLWGIGSLVALIALLSQLVLWR